MIWRSDDNDKDVCLLDDIDRPCNSLEVLNETERLADAIPQY